MIVTSEAIVLRSRKHGETSKIVTLYTREFGKLNVIAKGAREIKSKFGGALEMFVRTSAVFYKKEKQDGLYLLSKAEPIESNAGILKSLDRMEPATAIAELLLRAMHDEEGNPEIFELIAATLHAIAITPDDRSAAPLQFRFYFEFARIMGFEMDLRQSSESLSAEVTAARKHMQGSTTELASSLRLSERAKIEIAHFFSAYFAEHLSGVTNRSMKSGRVFSSLDRPMNKGAGSL
jgi:DNA repair protein RecO